MSGESRAVAATATSNASLDTMHVLLSVTNSSDAEVEVEIPSGTLLATAEESQQTIAVAGPRAELVAEGGAGDDSVVVAPGQSTIELVAFCGQEYDLGPSDPTPLVYAGTALAPLPAVLDSIMEAPSYEHEVAQEAVWWVTDDPVVPVPKVVAPLLDDVDTAAFAEAPVQVVPDAGYQPLWAGGPDTALGDLGDPTDGPGGAGSLLGFWVLAVVIGGAVIGGALWRSSRSGPTPARAGAWGAGWYPDPSGRAQARWWDGNRWTDHVR